LADELGSGGNGNLAINGSMRETMRETTSDTTKSMDDPASGSGNGAAVDGSAALGQPSSVPFNPDDPALYLNRELTWLSFNERVLHEARDQRNPPLERIKFLAITAANIDEFFMKRIGGLKQQVVAGLQERTVDGRTPREQIAECEERIRYFETAQREVLHELLEILAGHGVRIMSYAELTEAERTGVREFYIKNIFPLVTPLAMDPAHPFPFVSNLSLNLLVSVRDTIEGESVLARVKVPLGGGVARFLSCGRPWCFIPLEEVIANNLDLLFPGMQVEACEFFRVTRNANTERDEDEADDLLAMIESELRDRRFSPIVRLEVAVGMDPTRRGMLAAELKLNEQDDVFPVIGMMGLRDLLEIASLDLPLLHDPPHHPVDHPRLETTRNIFHVIRDIGPLMMVHPYESFSTSVERFLREASTDPKVRAIKMTLYRTSAESPIISYLCDAARNGKQVAVVIELKARFDEAANIEFAGRLEEFGIHVTYGVVGLKTHCKVILVVRQDYNGLRRYAHIGTGNYHPGTARVYSDYGLLTADDAIGQDLTELFNFLTTGYRPARAYRKLLPAPTLLKKKLIEKIRRESAFGTAGFMQIKVNALEDIDVTREIYEASRAGVKIDLIVRDTCRLRPGLAGISDSVRVISVVGRFLEHGRIYYFHNGGAEEYFIGSADCMKRNLESRIEVIAPIEDPVLRKKLRLVIDTQLAGQRGVWDMQPDGSYIERTPGEGISPQQTLLQFAETERFETSKPRRRRNKIARRALDSENGRENGGK